MNELDNYLQDSETYDLHPAEIATLLKELSDDEFDAYVAKLPKEILGDVALELPDRYFGNMVENLSVNDLSVAVSAIFGLIAGSWLAKWYFSRQSNKQQFSPVVLRKIIGHGKL